MLGCLNKYCTQHIKNCYHSSLPTKEGRKEATNKPESFLCIYIKTFSFISTEDTCFKYLL
jgi:hypothetical protein